MVRIGSSAAVLSSDSLSTSERLGDVAVEEGTTGTFVEYCWISMRVQNMVESLITHLPVGYCIAAIEYQAGWEKFCAGQSPNLLQASQASPSVDHISICELSIPQSKMTDHGEN